MAGYFMVADLLGFRQIVRNCTPELLALRVDDWTDLVEASARESGIAEFQLISDTVFAAAESSKEGLGQLISFAQRLLDIGVPKSLLIRGAIVHGAYTWGSKLIYGPAVIEAHELEMAQNWIGVTCGTALPHIADHWGHGRVLAYVPPVRAAPTQVRPVIDWKIPQAHELVLCMGGGGLSSEKQVMPGQVTDKLNNTIQFATYRRIATTNGFSPEMFYGANPMQVVELFVEEMLATKGAQLKVSDIA